MSALSQEVTKRYQQTDVHESITNQEKNNTNDPIIIITVVGGYNSI